MIRLYWSHCFGVAAAMEDSVGGGVVHGGAEVEPTPKRIVCDAGGWCLKSNG